jgi:hypothetical protein
MEMTYGLEIVNNEDQFLRAAIDAADTTTRAMVPGAFLVDIIPIRASREPVKHGMVLLTIDNSEVRT